MQGLPASQAVVTAKPSSDKVSPFAPAQQVSVAESQPRPLELAPSQHWAQANTKATTTAVVQPKVNGRSSKGQSVQKRKQAPAVPQQQKVKQQRLVYNEFSTSTESTIDSDCTMPLVDDEEGSNPREQILRSATRLKTHKQQQQQQQQQQKRSQIVFDSEPSNLLAATAARHQTPLPSPGKDKQSTPDGAFGKQGQSLQPECAATASGQLKHESQARQAAQAQKPPMAFAAAKGCVYKRQRSAQRTVSPVAQPRGVFAEKSTKQPAQQVH